MPNSASSPVPSTGTSYTVTFPADLSPEEQAHLDATGRRPVRVAVPTGATADTAVEVAGQLAAMQRTDPAATPALVTPAAGTLFDALAVELLNGPGFS